MELKINTKYSYVVISFSFLLLILLYSLNFFSDYSFPYILFIYIFINIISLIIYKNLKLDDFSLSMIFFTCSLLFFYNSDYIFPYLLTSIIISLFIVIFVNKNNILKTNGILCIYYLYIFISSLYLTQLLDRLYFPVFIIIAFIILLIISYIYLKFWKSLKNNILFGFAFPIFIWVLTILFFYIGIRMISYYNELDISNLVIISLVINLNILLTMTISFKEK
jgi:hypothetical protein